MPPLSPPTDPAPRRPVRREPETIPDFVTHYHLASRPPFLTLCDLADDRLDRVLRNLDRERAEGTSARVFGRRYMELRRRTEEKLRALFVRSGGRPVRVSPHYFVLGSSAWYEGLASTMDRVVFRLDDLPSEVTSVTYPDSFTAMGLGPDYGLPHEPRPYHERVYRLEELPDLIGTYGLPDDTVEDYEGYQGRPFERYVEVQLWSDGPLATLADRQAGTYQAPEHRS